jgi:carbonic anhydrase/acetyltransferase-like protein (isoleucine patch superfamily)
MSRNESKPRLSPSAYIAEGANVRGDFTVGDHASVWFNAVVRGDEGPVRIGECSNVQNCCVLHSDPGMAVEIIVDHGLTDLWRVSEQGLRLPQSHEAQA